MIVPGCPDRTSGRLLWVAPVCAAHTFGIQSWLCPADPGLTVFRFQTDIGADTAPMEGGRPKPDIGSGFSALLRNQAAAAPGLSPGGLTPLAFPHST